MNNDTRPQYIEGVQSGYDTSGTRGRWRMKDGAYSTKGRVLEDYWKSGSEASDMKFGFSVSMRDMTPATNRAEQIEHVLEGAVDIKRIIETIGERKPDPMPSDIRVMMDLSELFFRTEGDVFQLFETPMELALRPMDIDCPDKTFEKELVDIYMGDEGIDIDYVMGQLWLISDIFGQAFPLEIWNGDDELDWILHLPPRYVNVGNSMGMRTYGLLPSDYGRWTEEMVRTQIPEMAYNAFAPGWNEQFASGNDIPIANNMCHPVREQSFAFSRYAIPPMARAFRAITTRRIAEEMMRATMEGYKNQLWAFLVGDAEHPPSPHMVTALKNEIQSMAGERTGLFVWWNAPLDIRTIGPATFDGMSGMDTWHALTQHIYRQLGVHMVVVSGESSISGLGGNVEVNARMMLQRAKHKRDQLLRWERGLRMRIARRMMKGKSAEKMAAETRTEFARNPLEIADEVRDWLMPYYQAGALSTATFLQLGGFNYEAELANKKREQKNRDLFSAPATFSQTTVGPDGGKQVSSSPDKTGTQIDKGGRGNAIKARFENEPLFEKLLSDVFVSFDRLLSGNMNTDEFVNDLVAQMSNYAPRFAEQGYSDAGGAHSVNAEWVRGSSNFVNSFATRPGGLRDALAQAEDKSSLYWRVYLYPQELRHLAYMYGIQQAMKEHGARAWRRVLHPELSNEGPCEQCLMDSAIIHSIDEPFFDFHPNGVCTAQGVAYYTGGPEPDIEIPVPTKVTVPEMIRLIVERLGKIGKSIIRRIRNV